MTGDDAQFLEQLLTLRFDNYRAIAQGEQTLIVNLKNKTGSRLTALVAGAARLQCAAPELPIRLDKQEPLPPEQIEPFGICCNGWNGMFAGEFPAKPC